MSQFHLSGPHAEACFAQDAHGTSVRYFEAGQADSTRPPLIMIHGTGGSTQRHFAFLFPMLAIRQRVIAMDLCAPASMVEGLTLDMLEAQVLAVMDAATPEQPVTLLGYSQGAVLAASIAARFPERATNLILVAGWMKTDAQQRLRHELWSELRRTSPAALPKYMALNGFSPSYLASRPAAELAPLLRSVRLDSFVDRQMELNAGIDISDLVPRIRARTLVIGCREDQRAPRHHSKALFGAISDARYAEVASGHAVVMERPAEILRLIENFLAAPDAYPAGTIIPQARP